MPDRLDYFCSLVFDCPYKNEITDCPFRDVRKLVDIEERLDYYNKLSDEEYNRVINMHLNCPSRKPIISGKKS